MNDCDRGANLTMAECSRMDDRRRLPPVRTDRHPESAHGVARLRTARLAREWLGPGVPRRIGGGTRRTGRAAPGCTWGRRRGNAVTALPVAARDRRAVPVTGPACAVSPVVRRGPGDEPGLMSVPAAVISVRPGTWVSRPSRYVAGVVVLLFVLVGGCTDTGPGSFPRDVTIEIQAALRQRPDVVTVKVNYQNTLDAAARVDVNIMVKAGADFTPVVEDALCLLWQSPLDPLSSIRIDVVDEIDRQRGVTRHVDADRQRTQLNATCGPRPRLPADDTARRRIRGVARTQAVCVRCRSGPRPPVTVRDRQPGTASGIRTGTGRDGAR